MKESSGIYVGTSGWSYPKGQGSWNGHFYPPGIKDELEYYSQFFNTVEVNSSFYHPPSPTMTSGWVRRTPSSFCFAVKLWQKFTHPSMYRETTGKETVISKSDIDLFKTSLDPLAEHGKLGVLLAQFPPSFRKTPINEVALNNVFVTFKEYRLAAELRHRSWSDDTSTATLFSENKIAWVNIDEPRFQNSISSNLPLTSDIAYFRFHGRNSDNWWKGNTETRYQYLYSESELNELSERIKSIPSNIAITFVYFNNHWQGYAPRNATGILKNLKLTDRKFFSLKNKRMENEEDHETK